MNICPDCQHHNRVGELFCQECGNPLFEFKRKNSATFEDGTRKLAFVQPKFESNPMFGGTSSLGNNSSLALSFKDQSESLVIQPQEEMLIGRSDVKSNHYPDIDLSPYGALEEGISRVHARLQRDGTTITLTDLESVNGTFLNGKRLDPHQSRVLHDGDEIRLGKLVMNIYFK